MKIIGAFIFSMMTGLYAFAVDSVISSQVISKDKIITTALVDVGPCYPETNNDTHGYGYTISFPITVRETGQTWLESNGAFVAGSLTAFDRITTTDYSRRIPPNGAVWGTSIEKRVQMCKSIRASYVTNKDLSEKLFKQQD